MTSDHRGTLFDGRVAELATLGEAIVLAAEAMRRAELCFGHGTDNAEDEACWLVQHALGLSPLQPPDQSRLLDVADCQRIEALLQERIATRKPMAYLTGHTWFMGIELKCDERALVPRSPIAEWIANDFYGLFHVPPARVLDLCTGGGSIAIAIASVLPDARIDASDVSAPALSQARENLALHGLEERIRLLEGSLFEPVEGCYELIVCNPPYVDAEDLAAMPLEYAHEPALALEAGIDGLSIVRRILADAAGFLSPQGILALEVGNSATSLTALYPEVPFQWLQFEAGGSGVCVLTHSELDTYGEAFSLAARL